MASSPNEAQVMQQVRSHHIL